MTCYSDEGRTFFAYKIVESLCSLCAVICLDHGEHTRSETVCKDIYGKVGGRIECVVSNAEGQIRQ